MEKTYRIRRLSAWHFENAKEPTLKLVLIIFHLLYQIAATSFNLMYALIMPLYLFI